MRSQARNIPSRISVLSVKRMPVTVLVACHGDGYGTQPMTSYMHGSVLKDALDVPADARILTVDADKRWRPTFVADVFSKTFVREHAGNSMRSSCFGVRRRMVQGE